MHMLIADTCALINICNTSIADLLLSAPGAVCYQGLVEDECASHKEELESLVRSGKLLKFNGSLIRASAVGDLAVTHSLGLGESECLVIARDFGYDFISDDNKARRTATKILSGKVTGTIGLLCECIDKRILNESAAMSALEKAKAAGGHIPNYDFTIRSIVP